MFMALRRFLGSAPSHPFCVWNLQLGVGWSLDRNDRLILEAADGADVLIGHVAQRGTLGVKDQDQHQESGWFRGRLLQAERRGEPRVKDISDCLRVR